VAIIMFTGHIASASPSVPYDDPSAIGFIGLCDRNDQPIDHGSIDDVPFVWSAVSSVAASPPYDADGRTATLLAYQPREGLTAGEWSGQLLTASSRYDDPQQPTAAATDADDSLATFLDAYPANWDGFVELRLILGAPGEQARTTVYAATDIQVDGRTWRTVRGGTTACNRSASHSLEELVPQVQTNISTAAPAPGPAPTEHAASSSSTLLDDVHLTVLAPLLALVVAVGAALAWRRQRRAAA
jgi:hypothetical protein